MCLNTFAFMNNSRRQLIKMSNCSYAIGGKMMGVKIIHAFLNRTMISFGQASSGSLAMQEDFEGYLHKSPL